MKFYMILTITLSDYRQMLVPFSKGVRWEDYWITDFSINLKAIVSRYILFFYFKFPEKILKKCR